MSISDDIRKRIVELEGAELFHLPPLIKGDPSVRELFVSAEVKSIVVPPWPPTYVGVRHQSFRTDLDTFTRHDELRVSEMPFDKAWDADISRVHPVKREVWDFRSLEPPGIRCFGRFGGLNLFIALTYAYRENIEAGDAWLSSDDWDGERDRFERAWVRLFGDMPLFRGNTLDDYLTNYWPC